jgi:Dirigent-like protein
MDTGLLDKKELTMRAYMVYKYGANSTHVHSATPNAQDPKFGQLIVEDVPLMIQPAPFGRSLGSVRGLDVQASSKEISWQIYHNIIFEDL